MATSGSNLQRAPQSARHVCNNTCTRPAPTISPSALLLKVSGHTCRFFTPPHMIVIFYLLPLFVCCRVVCLGLRKCKLIQLYVYFTVFCHGFYDFWEERVNRYSIRSIIIGNFRESCKFGSIVR